MPIRFAKFVDFDTVACDLVVVIGTSLLVAPVADIFDWVKIYTHRLLVIQEIYQFTNSWCVFLFSKLGMLATGATSILVPTILPNHRPQC